MASPLLMHDSATAVPDTMSVVPLFSSADRAVVEPSHVACILPANGSVASIVSSFRSDANSSTVGPTCRICDYPGEALNQLISPCRCSGTSKFVHEQCLNKWLETINSHSSPHCEVCRYRIRTHKRYRTRSWHYPEISHRDRCLHAVFVVSLLVLIACAVVNVFGMVADSKAARRVGQKEGAMTAIEGVTLVSGLLFVIAFVVAIISQIKAKDNIYHLIMQCFATNTEWKIDNYQRSSDSLYAN